MYLKCPIPSKEWEIARRSLLRSSLLLLLELPPVLRFASSFDEDDGIQDLLPLIRSVHVVLEG